MFYFSMQTWQNNYLVAIPFSYIGNQAVIVGLNFAKQAVIVGFNFNTSNSSLILLLLK